MPDEKHTLQIKIDQLQARLDDAEQLIDAIKAGEVDAFAIQNGHGSEVYTLQSGDYAYRLLIEKFNEGALNISEDGLIVYSNSHFHQMLGLPYEKLVGTSIYEYIGLDYTEKFRDLLVNAFAESNCKGEINLIAHGYPVSVYVSLTSLRPHMDTVGMIVTDLTEKKENEKILAAKNVELQNQNTELASFTYIASHDLQEPLRKIQTFTGRILSNESASLSEKTRDYFDRIVGAASRMQLLIQDLLTYSRTNNVNLEKSPTDLNMIIEDVKRNLQDDIDNNHLIIESTALPVINAVYTHINQLFTNIVNNSVKYHTPGVTPHIKIKADIVSAVEIKTDSPIPFSRYWKISINDNGIGFDPEYQVKIFELFQRLHGKAEYPGTGIGLSICKKIVQNHLGFINAESTPGQGATFNIYLPTNNPS